MCKLKKYLCSSGISEWCHSQFDSFQKDQMLSSGYPLWGINTPVSVQHERLFLAYSITTRMVLEYTLLTCQQAEEDSVSL